MTQAIVLAGGLSIRTGMNKMSLPFHGEPLILNTINSVLPYVSKVVVVTGHYHDEITQLLVGISKIEIVKNEEYMLGMFSSVLCGVKHISEDFFIVPGDYPLIQHKTYKLMISQLHTMLVPSYKGIKGHPLLLSLSLKEALMKEPIESNLKAFRDRHFLEVIDTDDEGILQDIDTIQDYEVLKQKRKE
ncbi:MAG: nucleotidyltransferase family protein [Candidatus Izemoplasmatales bacterium]|jgi:molybdenum cofactor cytidylyltransferase|nr:nucleotidyltransferase family protein [Candidatus Izemoplasmatales bacterium]